MARVMKRQLHPSPSAEANDLKKTFSPSEVQRLVEREVHKAVKRSESRLQDVIDDIQKDDASFEHSIQKLQARVDLVSKRTEEALSYLTRTQKKSPVPLPDVDFARTRSEDDKMETTLQNETRTDCEAKCEELSRMVKTTKTALNKICKDDKELTAAIADLSHGPPPPVLTPYDSPDWTEPVEAMENESKHPGQEPAHSNRHGDAEGDNEEYLCYPRLPATTFPSVLSIEAASYSIPQRVEVKLALIKNPTRLTVLWSVPEKDPSAPPMKSYTIFMTMEKVKGSGVFPEWHTYDNVEAKTLPMCALIRKYKPGHKVCAAVLGKDVFGRYGPYSKVVTAAIPD